MRGASPFRTDGIQQAQAAAREIDRIGAYRARVFAPKIPDLVGRVKMGSGGIKGQPGRVRITRKVLTCGESPRGRIHCIQVNALAAAGGAFRALR